MGPRHNLTFCACKTAWLAPELLVSMCPSPHLWLLQGKQRLFDQKYKSPLVPDFTCNFVHAKQRDLHQTDKSIMGSSPHLCFFTWKTMTLGPDLQVCTGPRPRLWFWAYITACLAQEEKAYIVPSPHLWFLLSKQGVLEQNTSFYGYQHSPVLLCMQNGDFKTRITSLCGYLTSPVILCVQKSAPSIRITLLYGSQPSSVAFGCKTTTFWPE